MRSRSSAIRAVRSARRRGIVFADTRCLVTTKTIRLSRATTYSSKASSPSSRAWMLETPGSAASVASGRNASVRSSRNAWYSCSARTVPGRTWQELSAVSPTHPDLPRWRWRAAVDGCARVAPLRYVGRGRSERSMTTLPFGLKSFSPAIARRSRRHRPSVPAPTAAERARCRPRTCPRHGRPGSAAPPGGYGRSRSV